VQEEEEKAREKIGEGKVGKAEEKVKGKKKRKRKEIGTQGGRH